MGDAEVAVEVVLAPSKFEKQLTKLKSKLKNEEIDLDIKYGKADIVINDLRKQEKELDNLKKKQAEVNKEYDKFFKEWSALDKKRNEGGSFSGAEAMKLDSLDKSKKEMFVEQEQINQAVQKQVNLVNQLKEKHSNALAEIEKQENKVELTKQQIQDLTNEEAEYVEKIHEEAEAREKADSKAKLEQINQSIKNASNSTESLLKKVAKWGLAVFGVRSAYMFVRQAMSTLSQYDEKIGSDIQYIRFALASALKPIIETIINLVYKLLAYINYIAQAWFGVNLFANATVKAFKKVNSGVKDTNKSAKQLQKTLAGFDEMNILQDNGNTKTGGGGGGIATPSMDLSAMQDVEIPEWIKWIAENKETILNGLKEIGIAFLAAFSIIKLLEFVGVINKVSEALGGLGKLSAFGVIAGFALTLYGIIDLIGSLITGTASFESILKDVGLAIAGVGLAIVSLNATNLFGWITLVSGGLMALAGILSDNQDEVKSVEQATKDLEEAQRGVNEANQEYINASKTHLNAYKNYEKAQKNLTKTAKDLKISEDKLNEIGLDLFEGIRNGTIDISTLKRGEEELTKTYGLSKDQLMTVYEAYVDVVDSKAKLDTATDKLSTSEEKLTEAQKNQIQQELEQQRTIAHSTQNFEKYRDAVIDAYTKGAISGEEANDRLIEAVAETNKESRQAFVDDIPGYIQEGMQKSAQIFGGFGVEWRNTTDDIKIYTDSLAGKFESKFGRDIPNSVQKTIDKYSAFLRKVSQLKNMGNVNVKLSTSTSTTGNAKGAIYYPPKLAVGGIINQPGRGVPLAMGGERGAEGVIPLTDAQQMQRLGEAIGRYITVNASIVNTMNGRVISRELKQIQNDEDFAFNGG